VPRRKFLIKTRSLQVRKIAVRNISATATYEEAIIIAADSRIAPHLCRRSVARYFGLFERDERLTSPRRRGEPWYMLTTCCRRTVLPRRAGRRSLRVSRSPFLRCGQTVLLVFNPEETVGETVFMRVGAPFPSTALKASVTSPFRWMPARSRRGRGLQKSGVPIEVEIDWPKAVTRSTSATLLATAWNSPRPRFGPSSRTLQPAP
jgi:hypothetical protein